jgi:hypothetical protein
MRMSLATDSWKQLLDFLEESEEESGDDDE